MVSRYRIANSFQPPAPAIPSSLSQAAEDASALPFSQTLFQSEGAQATAGEPLELALTRGSDSMGLG